MNPMPAWDRASLRSASGRHNRMAVAKSPPLKADRPARKSSSGEPAITAEIASMDKTAATARQRARSFTDRFPCGRSGPHNAWMAVRPPLCPDCAPGRDRHRCSVWTRKDRPHPRKGRKQRRGAVFSGDADGGRQPVRGRRPRPDHSYVDKAVGTCAAARVEDVMEMSGRLEGGAITARHRKRHVFKLDRAGDAARRHAVADADPPGMTLRVATDGAKLAEIDHGAFEAFIAQQIRDGVGDKSLREAVEGDTHAGARKGDMRVAAVDIAEIHELSCDIAGAGVDVLLDVAVRPEMCFVEPPQWLHRDIEGAVAQYAKAAAFLHKGAQFARRLMQRAGTIETRDFAVLAVEAENALITSDLAADPQDGALRQRGIGVPQRQLGQ